MESSNTCNNIHHQQMEICRYIDAHLHEAAVKGKRKPFKDYDHGSLDCLLTPNESTILHIHLTAGTNISIKFLKEVLGICPSLLWKVNVHGDTLLHIAARHGHGDIAEELIQQAKASAGGEIIDLESGGGEAREREMVAVREMIRMTNKYKETALHEAARNEESLDVVKAILRHEDGEFTYSANDCGKTPLYLAAENGCTMIVLELVRTCNSKSLAYGGPNGKTALHAAAINRNTKPVKINELLKKWSNLAKEIDEKGWTPLHYAVYKHRTSTVEKLLEKDESSACIADKEWKRTPLHIAACRGFQDIVENIISKCPSCCELTDIRGWNVLHYAVISRSDQLLSAICKYPSLAYLLYGKDIKGNTPVHLYKAYNPKIPRFILPCMEFDKFNMCYCWDKLDDQIQKYSSSEKNEKLEWMKNLGTGPLGEIQHQKEKREENLILELEKVKDSHLVASTLVATITFAGAFTIPGGYISDEKSLDKGTPILSKNSAFKAFMISDSIAMVLSTCSVFIHLMLAILRYQKKNIWLIKCAYISLFYAMVAMMIAFVTGTYSFLSPSIGIPICVIGSSFFLLLSYSMIRIVFTNTFKGRGSELIEILPWLTGFSCSIIGIITCFLAPILGVLFSCVAFPCCVVKYVKFVKKRQ